MLGFLIYFTKECSYTAIMCLRSITKFFSIYIFINLLACSSFQDLHLPEFSPGNRASAAGPVREPQSISNEQPKFIWPVVGGKLSPIGAFGPRKRGRRVYLHKGIDILSAKGSPTLAAATGVVVYIGKARGYGKTVIIEHNPRWATLYAHLSSYNVKVNDYVDAGQQIGKVGRTGNATSNLLHFEIRHDEKPVPPLNYLPSESPNSLY